MSEGGRGLHNALKLIRLRKPMTAFKIPVIARVVYDIHGAR